MGNQIVAEGAGSPGRRLPHRELPRDDTVVQTPACSHPSTQATLDQVGPATSRPSQRHWAGIAARSTVLVYNPSMVAEADLPASMMDLADPKYAGQWGAAAGRRRLPGDRLGDARGQGRAGTVAWLAALKTNAKVYQNNIATMKAVNAGQLPMGDHLPLLLVPRPGAAPRTAAATPSCTTSRTRTPARSSACRGGGVLKSEQARGGRAEVPRLRHEPQGQAPSRPATSRSTPSAPAQPPTRRCPPLDSLEAPTIDPFTLDGPEVIELMTAGRHHLTRRRDRPSPPRHATPVPAPAAPSAGPDSRRRAAWSAAALVTALCGAADRRRRSSSALEPGPVRGRRRRLAPARRRAAAQHRLARRPRHRRAAPSSASARPGSSSAPTCPGPALAVRSSPRSRCRRSSTPRLGRRCARRSTGCGGAVLITTLSYFPFVFLPVVAALRGLDRSWRTPRAPSASGRGARSRRVVLAAAAPAPCSAGCSSSRCTCSPSSARSRCCASPPSPRRSSTSSRPPSTPAGQRPRRRPHRALRDRAHPRALLLRGRAAATPGSAPASSAGPSRRASGGGAARPRGPLGAARGARARRPACSIGTGSPRPTQASSRPPWPPRSGPTLGLARRGRGDVRRHASRSRGCCAARQSWLATRPRAHDYLTAPCPGSSSALALVTAHDPVGHGRSTRARSLLVARLRRSSSSRAPWSRSEPPSPQAARARCRARPRPRRRTGPRRSPACVVPLALPGTLAGVGAGVHGRRRTELTATLLLAPTGTRTLATAFWAGERSLDYAAAAPYAAAHGRCCRRP